MGTKHMLRMLFEREIELQLHAPMQILNLCLRTLTRLTLVQAFVLARAETLGVVLAIWCTPGACCWHIAKSASKSPRALQVSSCPKRQQWLQESTSPRACDSVSETIYMVLYKAYRRS